MTNRPSYENSHNMCNAMHVRGHTTGHRAACSCRAPPPPRHTQCVQGSQWVRQWCRAGLRRGQKGGFGQLLCFSSTVPVVHQAVVAAASVSAPLNLCSLAFQPAAYLVLSCFFYFLSEPRRIIALPCHSVCYSLLLFNFAQSVGFFKVVRWISLICEMDLSKLINVFL